jgi:hypothetical protein
VRVFARLSNHAQQPEQALETSKSADSEQPEKALETFNSAYSAAEQKLVRVPFEDFDSHDFSSHQSTTVSELVTPTNASYK